MSKRQRSSSTSYGKLFKQSVVELLQEVKYSASSDQDPIRDKRITMAILVSQRLATLYRLLKEWFVAIRQQIHSKEKQ